MSNPERGRTADRPSSAPATKYFGIATGVDGDAGLGLPMFRPTGRVEGFTEKYGDGNISVHTLTTRRPTSGLVRSPQSGEIGARCCTAAGLFCGERQTSCFTTSGKEDGYRRRKKPYMAGTPNAPAGGGRAGALVDFTTIDYGETARHRAFTQPGSSIRANGRDFSAANPARNVALNSNNGSRCGFSRFRDCLATGSSICVVPPICHPKKDFPFQA